MHSPRKSGGLIGRLGSLESLHADLEARIGAEMTRPLPDNLFVHKLKRLRVRAKDEIANITGVLRTVNRTNRQNPA